MPAYNIHGILTIRSDRRILNRAFHQYFEVDAVSEPDIVIEEKDFRLPTAHMDRHDNWFYGRDDLDLVYYQDRLLGQSEAVLLEDVLGSPTYLTYQTIDFPNVTPGSRGSIGDLVEAIIDFKLIERGYTTLHAASLSKDGRAVLLCGFPNVGKTLSTLALLQDGWAYMGDDNGVIGRDGTVYTYPSTSSIGYDDFLQYIDPSAIGRGRYYKHLARVWPMQFAVVERLFDYPEVYLPDIGFEQGTTADGDVAVCLEIGSQRVTEVGRDAMVANIQASTDYSRPRIWQNPFFQVWAYFTDSYLTGLQQTERDIIWHFLQDVDCYTAACEMRNWGETLAEIV